MPLNELETSILNALTGLDANQQPAPRSSTDLTAELPASWSSIKRHLDALVAAGLVVREGQSRATRYRLRLAQPPGVRETPHPRVAPAPPVAIQTEFMPSAAALALRKRLQRPLGAREPVGYNRGFVDSYVPNETFLLPSAGQLAEEGRLKGQQPAGTYARKVLAPLLVDLSWSSSRLEGNRYTLLATEELFRMGTSTGDPDAVMLLNHKAAIEFMVDAVPEYGLGTPVVRNLHALLMQDLLVNSMALGNFRQTLVNISDTTYVPPQAPALLGEMFDAVIAKAQLIKNAVEAAFFLWVNLAYLQPFEDGNKRTSRLAANIPLMLYNCAPLSFIDVDTHDYAHAMMSVYENNDVTLAADLFTWAYRRSVRKYAVQLDAVGVPDPTRARFRDALTAALGSVVRDRKTLQQAMLELRLSPHDAELFLPIARQELATLDLHNCARYRLGLGQTSGWIAAGRPG